MNLESWLHIVPLRIRSLFRRGNARRLLAGAAGHARESDGGVALRMTLLFHRKLASPGAIARGWRPKRQAVHTACRSILHT